METDEQASRPSPPECCRIVIDGDFRRRIRQVGYHSYAMASEDSLDNDRAAFAEAGPPPTTSQDSCLTIM